MLDRTVERDGGVVHEGIDKAQLTLDLVDRRRVAHVQAQPGGDVEVAKRGGVAGGRDHLMAAGCEQRRCGPPDAGAGSGD